MKLYEQNAMFTQSVVPRNTIVIDNIIFELASFEYPHARYVANNRQSQIEFNFSFKDIYHSVTYKGLTYPAIELFRDPNGTAYAFMGYDVGLYVVIRAFIACVDRDTIAMTDLLATVVDKNVELPIPFYDYLGLELGCFITKDKYWERFDKHDPTKLYAVISKLMERYYQNTRMLEILDNFWSKSK